MEQAILATGLGYGAFITISSYNKRSNNLVGDSLLILLGHALLSFLQLLTVVGFVGFVAVKTGLKPVELLDKGKKEGGREAGRGDADVAHPRLPVLRAPHSALDGPPPLRPRLHSPQRLCELFFQKRFLFHLQEGQAFFQYLLALSVLATLEDALGERWSRCFPRFVLAVFTAALTFSLSLYFSTQAGRHAYELASGFLKYITLWAILTFQLLVAGWFYCEICSSLWKSLQAPTAWAWTCTRC